MERLSKETVLFHVNTDTPEGKKLRAEYRLRGIPTVVLLDGKGRELDRVIGYENRSDWMRTYLAALYGVDTLDDFLARAGDGADPELDAKVARKYLDRQEAAKVVEWVAKARGAKDGKPKGLDRELALMDAQAALLLDPEKGQKALTALIADPKGGSTGDEAFDTLSRYYKKSGKDRELAALYDGRMARKGNDASFLNDYAWTFAEKGINLPRALAAAQKAARLSKEEPGVLDTLAEVYFKMGKRAEALATIEKAIAKQPEDKYFQEQREKFAGDGQKKAP